MDEDSYTIPTQGNLESTPLTHDHHDDLHTDHDDHQDEHHLDHLEENILDQNGDQKI